MASSDRQALEPLIDAAGAIEPDESQAFLPLGELEGASEDGDQVAQVSRIGRPKGSRNRRTKEMADYITARYTHPLETLAQIWSRPTDQLASELGVDKDEALDRQIAAARAGLPYLAQKQPMAVHLKNERGVVIQIFSGDDDGGDDGDGFDGVTLEGVVVSENDEPDQPLSEASPSELDT